MFNDTIYNNTYTALKLLIDNSYYSQITNPPKLNAIGGETQSAWREYCTVKLCTSRQSGHTNAMCKVAYEYFDRAILISDNKSMSERIRSIFTNVISTGCKSNVEIGVKCHEFEKHSLNVIKVNEYKEYFFDTTHNIDKLIGCDVEAIFIDCASFVSKNKIDSIYDYLGPCMSKYPQNFFVFVE